MELYGGGPEVKLSGKDLSSYLSPEHKVEVILFLRVISHNPLN